VLEANSELAELTGVGVDHLAGQRIDTVLARVQRVDSPPGRAAIEELVPAEQRRLLDGGTVWVRRVEVPVDEPTGEARRLHVIDDVTGERAAVIRLDELANFDPLTGLLNRSAVVRAIDAEFENGLVMCMSDVDGFTTLNESLGPDAGDAILLEIGRRLRSGSPDGALVARFGADSFCLVCHEMTADDLAANAAGIQEMVAAPIAVGDEVVYPTVSMGVLRADSRASAAECLNSAEAALRRAKLSGRGGFAWANPEELDTAPERQALITELQQAISVDDQIALFYQPIVDLGTGEFAGVEALVRWNHPTRGLLEPGAFLPLA